MLLLPGGETEYKTEDLVNTKCVRCKETPTCPQTTMLLRDIFRSVLFIWASTFTRATRKLALLSSVNLRGFYSMKLFNCRVFSVIALSSVRVEITLGVRSPLHRAGHAVANI